MRSDEIWRRALGGSVSLAARGLGTKAIGFFGFLVLARLLSPRDFGILAIGFSLISLVERVMFGGLGAGLMRRPEAPSNAELASVVWFQVLFGIALCGALGLLAPLLGPVVATTAIMAGVFPLTSLRLGSTIMLERELRFARIAIADVVETLVYFGVAIGLVLAGLGIYGVALAAPVRAAAGSAVFLVTDRRGLSPRGARFSTVRGLARFGAQFQGVGVIGAVREQVLNFCVAGLAGFAVLGVWSLALRILQLPYVILQSMWRVSFPAFQRLRESGPFNYREVGARAQVSTAAVGLFVSAVAAIAGPMVPVIFGAEWTDAALAVQVGCIALPFLVPSGVFGTGLLYALERADRVVIIAAWCAVVWAAVALALLPLFGAVAISLGWVAAGALELALVAAALRRQSGHSLIPAVWRGLVVAIAPIGFAIATNEVVRSPAAGLALSLALTVGAWIVLYRLLMRTFPRRVTAVLRRV